MTDWPGGEDVTGKVVRVTTLAGRVGRKGDAMKNGHPLGGGLGVHPGRRLGSRVFPRGWETRASALGQLGNQTVWNPVLNCAAQAKC